MATRPRFRAGVAFSVAVSIPTTPPKAGEPQPNPRWIHTATEGQYDGYPGGATITRETLTQIVKNFKADPRFKGTPNGLGSGRVVPFDIAHISEMDPRLGNPLANEQAMAWALDVAIRDGADGKAQLWTYAELGDEVKLAIEANPPKVNYVSIAFTPTAVDPHSGQPIGALMTSIAFTNKPFIRELTPLAASAEAARFIGAAPFLGRFCEPARTDEDAVGMLRSVLNLPLSAAPDEVLSHVERIIGWALSDSTPAGVDADEVLEDIRTILSIPIATPTDQVLAQVRTVFERLATPPGASPAMTNPAVLTKLFTLFAINPAAENAEAALVAAATDQIAMGKKLGDILSASGFGDLASLVKQVPDLLKAKERLSGILGELSTALSTLAGVDNVAPAGAGADAEAAVAATMSAVKAQLTDVGRFRKMEQEAEVSAVMRQHNMPEAARASLAFHLRSDPKTFRAQYPLPDDTRKHLLSTFAAGRFGEVEPQPNGTRMSASGNGDRESVTLSERDAGDKIDLRTFSGRNTIERAMSYLASKEAGFDKLDITTKINRARQFCEQNHSRIVAL